MIANDLYRYRFLSIDYLVKYVVQYSDIAYSLDIQQVLNREFFAPPL